MTNGKWKMENEDSVEQFFPDPVAVLNAFFQHAPVFIHLDVTFTAEHHQISVVAEVAVPFDDLLVAPCRVIPPHLFIVHAVEIGAQIDAGFIHRLICRFLLEVPNRLSHIENQSESCSANCPAKVSALRLPINTVLTKYSSALIHRRAPHEL